MADNVAVLAGGDDTAEHRDIWDNVAILLVAAAVIGAVLAGAGVWLLMRPDTPGNTSVEAGFARDMSLHHSQAVEMALIIRDTTQNEEIRTLATDIILTQQTQIGMMRGWLGAWDLPLNSDEPPMAWADMSGMNMSGQDMTMSGGLMVGMATADEIQAFRGMTGVEADREFLRLMIAHHKGGIMMATAALDASDNTDVRQLAQSIVNGQQAEIDLMESLLARIGPAS